MGCKNSQCGCAKRRESNNPPEEVVTIPMPQFVVTNVPIKVKKLMDSAVLPEYKTLDAAGMDLYAAENAVLVPGKVTMVATGLAVEIPRGYELQIRARSGMAAKGVMVVNGPGTIDSDYRGHVKILLTYVNELQYGRFQIEVGDRIAQAVLAPVTRAKLIEVEELSDTERGEGGFGSTGVK
jgi:dUTP pyrophosphatase